MVTKRPVPTVRQFAIEVGKEVDYYNENREHRGIGGGIPRRRFDEDPTPLDLLEPEYIARALMRRGKGTVRKASVTFEGVAYTHAALFPHEGRDVEIGWRDDHPESIEVLFPRKNNDADWLCTATPIESASKGMSGRVYNARRHSIETVRSAHEAAERLTDETTVETNAAHPDPDDAVGRSTSSERRRKADEARRAAAENEISNLSAEGVLKA
jgi:hypothetical protein